MPGGGSQPPTHRKETGMKIIQLTASNVKRLRAVNIKPDGNMVIIGGQNWQGKTSVLDSIAMGLGGKRLVPDRPIHTGQDRAEINIDLGDLKVKRTFTHSGTYLTVENADGAVFRSPQEILDKIVGNLTFDPELFVSMDAKKQVNILRELMQIDFTALDGKRKLAFDTRTDLKRDIIRIETRLEGMNEPAEDCPTERVDVRAVAKEINEANELKRQNEATRRQLDSLQRKYDEQGEEVRRSEEMVREAEEVLAAAEKAHEDAKGAWRELEDELGAKRGDVADLVEPDDDAISKRLVAIEVANAEVAIWEEWKEETDERDRLAAKVAELTKVIVSVDEAKGKILARAKYPIAGLSFGESGVEYKGIPFSEASGAEKILVSAAIGIAMNPKLKVLFYRDASRLDKNSLGMIADLVEKTGHQVWLERVGDEANAQVVIEDGYATGPAALEIEDESREEQAK